MKKSKKSGFTLIEMLATVGIIVLLAVGISTGINAAMRAYTKSVFESDCGTLSDILNATIGDILRYSDVDSTDEGFLFTNYDYNVRNAAFDTEDIDGEGSGGYVILKFKKSSTAEEETVYIVNKGAYADYLKVTDLEITPTRIYEYQNKTLFDVSYTIRSLKDDDLNNSVRFRVRQANADVAVNYGKEKHEAGEEPSTPFSSDNITVQYDSNLDGKGVGKYVIRTFWGYSGTFIQMDDPNISTTIHVIGDDDILCDWYTILSWNTKADGSGHSYTPGEDCEINMDDVDEYGILSLYAQWKKTEFRIHYCPDKEHTGEEDGYYAEGTFKLGDTITIDHYNPDGVIQSPVGKTVTFDYSNKETEEVSALSDLIKWKVCNDKEEVECIFDKAYTASVDGFIKTFDPSSKKKELILYPVWSEPYVTMPEAIKIGWDFNGWAKTYIDSTDSKKYIQAEEKQVIKEDTTYLAQYQTKLYFVTNPNDTNKKIEKTYHYGCSIPYPDNEECPKETGYHYKWYTDNNFRTEISEDTIEKDNIKTYYLKKIPNTYTVKFNGNDPTGGSVPENRTFNYGEKKQLTPEDYTQITKDGWTFDGWSKEQYAGKDNVVYADNYDESFISTEDESDVTLYARWKCDVDYDLNGGTGTAEPVDYYYGTTTLTLPQPTRTGYTFDGWYAPDGQKLSTPQQATDYVNETGNCVITAHWQVNTYKITISTNNATINKLSVADITKVPYGTTVSFSVAYSEGSNKGTTVVGESGETYEPNVSGDLFSFTMPAENVTITSTSSSSSCITGDTLITMADGTQKQIRSITPGEEVLVFNHETGKLDTAPLDLIVHYGAEQKTEKVWHLLFDDGTAIRIIKYHGFFDLTLNEYVYIKPDNYEDFYGHEFYSLTAPNHRTKFVKAYCATETTDYYAPITKEHLNLFANGMLTMTSSMEGLFNIFELDENMKYDTRKMNADIQKYGLFSYDDFKAYIPYEIYDYFPAPYLKVAVGKGNITFEHIIELAKKFCYEALAPEDVSDASVSH